MPDVTVTARWAAGFPVHYAPESRILHPDDEAQVPVNEAVDSEHWEGIGGKKAIDAALKELAKREKAAAASDEPDDGPKPATVAELRAALKERGLPATGKRAELEARLAEAKRAELEARLAEADQGSGDQPDPDAGDAGDAGDDTSTGGEG